MQKNSQRPRTKIAWYRIYWHLSKPARAPCCNVKNQGQTPDQKNPTPSMLAPNTCSSWPSKPIPCANPPISPRLGNILAGLLLQIPEILCLLTLEISFQHGHLDKGVL